MTPKQTLANELTGTTDVVGVPGASKDPAASPTRRFTGYRLLFVVNDAPYFLSHRLTLAIAARAAGLDVHVATAPSPAQRRIRAEGFPAHSVPLSRFGLRPDRELAAVLAVRRLIRRIAPDLIHFVTLKATVLGGIGARLTRSHAAVFSITGMGHMFTEPGPRARLLCRLFRVAFPMIVPPRSKIIVQNKEDLAQLSFSDRLRRQLVLIPGSGVDFGQFRPRPETGGTVQVLLPSRMIWKKGIREFVQAARLLHARGVAARFVLAGDNDPGNPGAIPSEQLSAWDREGDVVWLGFRCDMPELVADSHIVCLPSYYGEGVPKCLIEAAAAGRPIVTTDMPGCRDIVRDGENGILVPPRDPGRLAEAIRRLTDDPDLRRRMGERGREVASGEFSIDTVIDRTLAVYGELIEWPESS